MAFKQKQSNERIETSCPACNQKITSQLSSNFAGMKSFDCPDCQKTVFLNLSKNMLITYVALFIYFIYDLIQTYGSSSGQIWVMVDVVVIGLLVYTLLKHFNALKVGQYKIIEDRGKEE